MASLAGIWGRRREAIGLIDIGSSKIACAIAEPGKFDGVHGGPTALRIRGLGHHRARGIKSGVVVDIDEAEKSVRAAVAQAERRAECTIREAVVSVSCGRQASLLFSASSDIAAGVVGDADVARTMTGAKAYAERDGRRVLHINRLGCRLDDAVGADEPVGLAAARLTIDCHAVTADEAPLRNILLLMERAYLTPAAILAAPFASALGVTDAEDRQVGVTVVDIGAGVTSIASFLGGRLVYASVIPSGGLHIDYDIARALQAPLIESARIKSLYATLAVARSDLDRTFSYSLAADRDGEEFQTTFAELADIIRPRIQHLLNVVGEKIDGGCVPPAAAGRIVLTGGTSQLEGLPEFTANMLGRPVRRGVVELRGAASAGEPGFPFANVAGMVEAFTASDLDVYGGQAPPGARSESYLGRVGAWLKSGF